MTTLCVVEGIGEVVVVVEEEFFFSSIFLMCYSTQNPTLCTFCCNSAHHKALVLQFCKAIRSETKKDRDIRAKKEELLIYEE